MKLSKRLKQIDKMVTAQYSHIWDCCCDHGFLGAALLNRQTDTHIHFVDIVPELMAELDTKLQRFYSNAVSKWKTHCLDVATLPLEKYQGNHLVIIAGVGGDLMIQFIEAIHQNHQNLAIDFLLCPVHHQFALRHKLIELDFSLKQEVLVEDNKRFYEILLVSSAHNEHKPITAIGDQIWHSQSPQQAKVVENYLHKTLNHYQRIQQGDASKVEHIIDAYSAVIPVKKAVCNTDK